MIEYKKVQSNEENLTKEIQDLNWIESFAYNILKKNPNIEPEVNGLPYAKFSEYSGIKQGGYLGKFFYIARYVDEVQKAKYMATGDIEESSPIYNITHSTKKYDQKPWDVKWEKIPQYTKTLILRHRNSLINNTDGFTFRKQKRNEDPTDYNNLFLKTIGEHYNKQAKGGKIKFMRSVAIQGTRTPIVQAQSNAKTYLQGYIMNILALDGSDDDVKKYYQSAVDKNMGLLSGPSGTAHRVNNLVKETYQGDYNLDIKIKTAALCLAALGVPYNCHSFYEIVTVILPKDDYFHDIEKFREKVLGYTRA